MFDALVQNIMTKLERLIDAAERADGRRGRRFKQNDIFEAGRPLALFFSTAGDALPRTPARQKKGDLDGSYSKRCGSMILQFRTRSFANMRRIAAENNSRAIDHN